MSFLRSRNGVNIFSAVVIGILAGAVSTSTYQLEVSSVSEALLAEDVCESGSCSLKLLQLQSVGQTSKLDSEISLERPNNNDNNKKPHGEERKEGNLNTISTAGRRRSGASNWSSRRRSFSSSSWSSRRRIGGSSWSSRRRWSYSRTSLRRRRSIAYRPFYQRRRRTYYTNPYYTDPYYRSGYPPPLYPQPHPPGQYPQPLPRGQYPQPLPRGQYPPPLPQHQGRQHGGSCTDAIPWCSGHLRLRGQSVRRCFVKGDCFFEHHLICNKNHGVPMLPWHCDAKTCQCNKQR
eukprot:TRINITY_DN33728_c0_g1_i1.p1 TRINITY_DN33728_c0_g1~~TRINITY_DN33728_c0_g1_i1.p1  ORF type:complete len:290 (+),score=28.09 TRINITY_DN33728_c0_g1_i1:80-949(+)